MKAMSLTKTFQGLKASTSSKNISSTCYARLRAGHFHIMSSPQENFPIKQKKEPHIRVTPSGSIVYEYCKY